jgi:hypothetical protein
MADQVFNIAKGAFVEKFRDSAAQGLILLLKTAEADATLIDYDTIALILAGANVECDFTNYARKTGLTGTITVDDTNNRVDVDIADQTWTSAGGGTNNNIVKAIFAYQESAADSGRVPLAHYDFVVTTDGSNLTLEVNASGALRAS